MPGSLWTETTFIASIVGAIIGGSCTIAAQWYGDFRRNKHTREDDLISLFFKLAEAAAICKALRNGIEAGRKLRASKEHPLCGTVPPFANLPKSIEVSPGERRSALFLRDAGLMKHLNNFILTYDAIPKLCITYNKQRESIDDLVNVIGADRQSAHVMYNSQDYEITSRFAAADYLLEDMEDMFGSIQEDALTAARIISLVLRTRRILDVEIEFKKDSFQLETPHENQ